MKTKILLSLGAISVAFLGLFSFKNNDDDLEAKMAKEAISRWVNLDDAAVLNALKNEEGLYLSQVSFSKKQLEGLLSSATSPEVSFDLSVGQSGKIGFVVNGKVQTSATYGLNMSSLKADLKSFEKAAYAKQHAQLAEGAQNHLIDYDAAAQMIERWENASQIQRVEALVAENGQRLNSLSFDQEVFQKLSAMDRLSDISLQVGLNGDMKLRVIAIGVNSDGELMLNQSGVTNAIFDFSRPCPPICCPDFCWDDQ